MKLFKKFAIALTCALCTVGVCLSFAACGTNDPDADLPEGTYVFYVYYDGTNPVEGAQLEICFNNSETTSTCYINYAVTDENGRAEIDLSALSQYSAYNPNGYCVHFTEFMDSPVGFPEGYTYPANAQTVTLNGGAQYETAWYVSSQVTTFTLVSE